MESIQLTVFYGKRKANMGHLASVFCKISREAKHIRKAAFSNKHFRSYCYFVDFLKVFPAVLIFLVDFRGYNKGVGYFKEINRVYNKKSLSTNKKF